MSETFVIESVSMLAPNDRPGLSSREFHDWYEARIKLLGIKNCEIVCEIIRRLINDDFVTRNTQPVKAVEFLDVLMIQQQASRHDLFIAARGFGPLAEVACLRQLDAAADFFPQDYLLTNETIQDLRDRENFFTFRFEMSCLMMLRVAGYEVQPRPQMTKGAILEAMVCKPGKEPNVAIECKTIGPTEHLASFFSRTPRDIFVSEPNRCCGRVKLIHPLNSSLECDEAVAELAAIALDPNPGIVNTKYFSGERLPFNQERVIEVRLEPRAMTHTLQSNLKKVQKKFRYGLDCPRALFIGCGYDWFERVVSDLKSAFINDKPNKVISKAIVVSSFPWQPAVINNMGKWTLFPTTLLDELDPTTIFQPPR